MQTTVASISRHFFEFVAKRFSIFRVSFDSFSTRFLVIQSRFVQQPTATQEIVLTVKRFFEKIVEKSRHGRRRVNPDFGRRLVADLIQLILFLFDEFTWSP
jgi:hypothetical protein